MKEFFEILVFIINVLMVFAAIWLARVVAGSIFSAIPWLLGIMAISLTFHSAVDLFVTGRYQSFVYGLTALIATFAYLALTYGIYLTLRQIALGGDK